MKKFIISAFQWLLASIILVVASYANPQEEFNTDAFIYRGIAHDEMGQHDEAITGFNRAKEVSPEYARSYNNRGIIYRNKGKYDQAISNYSKAIEINPNYTGAYNNRGNAYCLKGLYDEAISDYTKAIELNPKLAVAYGNRGLALILRSENTEQGYPDIVRACELGNCEYLNRIKKEGLCQ